MPSNDASQAELLYPFYLDTDMTMAFAAALTGGVALQSEDVGQAGHEEQVTKQLKAGLRLFDALDFGAGRRRSRKQSAHLESRVIRQHTEASIFINLMEELRRRGSIVDANVDTLQPGQLVSLQVGPATAPLLRVVNQILRLLDITNPEPIPEAPAPAASPSPKAKPGRTTTPLPKPANQPPSLTAPKPDEDASVTAIRSLFRSLKGDLEFSGMTDIVVRREEGVSILLTLDNRFITDQVLELLHTSTSTVIGKVTQVWKSNTDFINLYRRSVLSLVPALPSAMGFLVLAMLGALGKGIDVGEIQKQTNEALGLATPDIELDSEVRISDDFQAMLPIMQGPALQILPLAVCT